MIRSATSERMEPSFFAYLDPGSGSLLLQAVLGGVAAAGVIAKVYWRRLLRLLRIRKADEEHP